MADPGGRMTYRFGWGNAEFLGEWTLEQVVAFVKRVDEIRMEEQAKAMAAGADDE